MVTAVRGAARLAQGSSITASGATAKPSGIIQARLARAPFRDKGRLHHDAAVVLWTAEASEARLRLGLPVRAFRAYRRTGKPKRRRRCALLAARRAKAPLRRGGGRRTP